ncbi:NDR1/HIN1-like protein 12 [Cicer arietinum]|uniref:NDR1/HIN1-like protein 12 n=1 Tax=Cicer arietinum TaxID=3827 RepID=A0A1S2YZE4_CICAR|nr:NDR1/HIN1-like protein 12 [Cicer arietinum]
MPSPHYNDHDQEAYNHDQSQSQSQSQYQNQPQPYDRTPKKRIIVTHRNGNTNLFIWLLAILCTIIAIGVVIGGIVVFVGYIVIHPRVPTISISNAHLDLFRNDYAGLLQTQLNIRVLAQNGNAKAHATFSDIKFLLSYQGQGIAIMVADTFDVPKNNSQILNYVVQSSSIPLTPDQVEVVDETWKRNVVGFDFKGHARTQWRVGPLGSLKFWCKLECQLRFHPLNGSYIPSRCTSQSK